MLSDDELDQIEEEVQQAIAILRDIWTEHAEDPNFEYIDSRDVSGGLTRVSSCRRTP
jgi:hypothetical protein